MRGISVANKRRQELLDLPVKARDSHRSQRDEQGDQMGISAKLVKDDGTNPDPYLLAQIGLDVIH